MSRNSGPESVSVEEQRSSSFCEISEKPVVENPPVKSKTKTKSKTKKTKTTVKSTPTETISSTPATVSDHNIILGIDLGTTYSCVAVWKDGQAVVIPNDSGARTTPSYVAFTDTERLVGQAARDQGGNNPVNTIFDVKRIIGRKFDDPAIQEDCKNWPFKVVKGYKNQPMLVAQHRGELKEFCPEEISAMVLAKIKMMAEEYLNVSNITDAVITVPAYFNDSQRQATKDASQIAGLNCVRIINEPTAAALAYGLDKKCKDEQKILIIDFGGGTFDVSLLEIEGGIFEVVATSGDTHLGGEDLDHQLVNYVCDEFMKKHKLDLRENKKALRRVRVACEKAKVQLSSMAQTIIELDSLHQGLDLNLTLTRAKFEEICHNLFKRCIAPIKKVLSDAKIEKSEVDELVLVGGSTRIPKVQQMVKDLFKGKEINKSTHPDESIACGACIQGAMLSKIDDSQTKELLLLDVTPLSLGVLVAGGLMSVIIDRNTKIPCKKTDLFTTYVDNQKAVQIDIYEGERQLIKDNNLLGSFELQDIPPASRSVPQIEVTFEINHNGILTVSAVHTNSENQNSNQIKIAKNKGRLTSKQIQRLVAEAEKYKQEDAMMKIKIEARNQLESLVYQVKNNLDDADIKKDITKEEKDRLLICAGNIRKWLEENADAKLEDYEYYRNNLEHVSHTIFTRIYTNIPAVTSDNPEIRNSVTEIRGSVSENFSPD